MADQLHLPAFDGAFPFIGTDLDPRPMPRLSLHVALSGLTGPTERLHPMLDTGAKYTVFDGAVALRLGWSETEIQTRARETLPIYGLGAGAPMVRGYLHEVTCLIPFGGCFAELAFRAFLTPPNTLSTPVLGRRGFFEQVDFALLQAERRFCLRFRNRSVVRAAW